MLEGVRASLPPGLPLAKVGQYLPLVLWVLSSGLLFLALLAYAPSAPLTLIDGWHADGTLITRS